MLRMAQPKTDGKTTIAATRSAGQSMACWARSLGYAIACEKPVGDWKMNVGDLLVLLIAVALLVYLTWALLKPEAF